MGVPGRQAAAHNLLTMHQWDLPLAVDHFRYFAGCVRAREGSAAEIEEFSAAYLDLAVIKPCHCTCVTKVEYSATFTPKPVDIKQGKSGTVAQRFKQKR